MRKQNQIDIEIDQTEFIDSRRTSAQVFNLLLHN